MTRRILGTVIALLALSAPLRAATPAENLARKPDAWFRSDEGRAALECILSWQTDHGDWPKDTDTTRQKFSGDRAKLAGTFDNGATTGELRTLARAVRATADARYEKAFLAGFDLILKAQYPNGGWPQHSPPGKSYHRHITFNDNTMIRLMRFLRDAATLVDYAFLDQGRRAAAAKAVERGVGCVVKCQVMVQGTPTVWGAQHDEVTLAPAQGRSFEAPSLSGAESAGILLFLMSLDQPTPEVVRAVKAGVAWFESARIEGYRYRKGGDPDLIKDPSAGPLWARFYEIDSNRPIFSGRDGVVKYDIEQLGVERRGGYTWYGNWGEGVAKAYAKWPHR